jgi:exoribonuclease R
MLLANITVGKKILRHFPTLSVLRRHPSPSKSQFAPLISAAKSVGFDISKLLVIIFLYAIDKFLPLPLSLSLLL